MHIERIETRRAWTEAVVIRLFRRWAAAREAGEGAASLTALAHSLGVEAAAAVALDSLLQLTEACLGRSLRSECCCSRDRSGDERALLLLIGSASRQSVLRANEQVPHGLPSALLWAAASLNHLLGEALPPPESRPILCPFG